MRPPVWCEYTPRRQNRGVQVEQEIGALKPALPQGPYIKLCATVSDICRMYWCLGVLGIFVLLVVRRRFSLRTRICRCVLAAQQALNRRDFQSFDQNLERSKQMTEALRDEALRDEFRGDLALMGVQGAYWRGDIAGAELAARRAIELLASLDPTDRRGKLALAHFFLGDIFLDNDQPAQAAEAFRASASLAEKSTVPVAAVFSLQRLADALLEEEKREDAATVIDRCVEIEKEFFASRPGGKNEPPAISMTAPDQSLVRGDFATAEKLFGEKVRAFESSEPASFGIDVMRYQWHLAAAQKGQGNVEKAIATLASACAAAEERLGSQHPRVAKIRRKIESLQQQ